MIMILVCNIFNYLLIAQLYYKWEWWRVTCYDYGLLVQWVYYRLGIVFKVQPTADEP